ncbi:MAG TPA: single-stranded DNA-binding protein [Acetobacteraceae bacterium]|nr:single-stranded DNA-binding protein [Acetobacteraceae bacterium]
MQKNYIELAGYLAAKPELRFLPSGTKVANVRLGETYHFAGRDGKPQSHTNWHGLVFYSEVADVAMTYEQGENIHVEGSLQQRKFTPADGITRTVHEVHVKACHVIAATRLDREVPASPPISTETEVIRPDSSWPV